MELVRARVLLVLFLLLLTVALGAYAGSEVMRVRQVVVLGCEARDPADVVNLAAIENEESILRLDFAKIRARIDEDPYFQVQSIAYVFPDRVRIEVKERRAAAAVRYLDSFLLIDETGFVLETRNDLGDTSVPVVSSLRVNGGYAVRETVTSSIPSQMDALRAILTELHSQNAIQLVSEINLESVSDLWMTTVSGYEVRLGNFADMGEKIRWLRAVEPILVSEGYEGGVITVSTGENASYLAPQQIAPQEAPDGEAPDGGESGAEEPDTGAPDGGGEAPIDPETGEPAAPEEGED